jgi:hypothetical protein
MKKYDIKHFDLEKTIYESENVKMLISGKVNSGKQIIVKKVLKILKNKFFSPIKNIIVYSKSEKFKEKIKKSYTTSFIYFYDNLTSFYKRLKYMQEFTNIKNNVLIICENITDNDYNLLNSFENIIMINKKNNEINFDNFNIIMNFVDFDMKNLYKNYISQENYDKILKNFNNKCFLVMQKNNLTYYSLNNAIYTNNNSNSSNTTNENLNNLEIILNSDFMSKQNTENTKNTLFKTKTSSTITETDTETKTETDTETDTEIDTETDTETQNMLNKKCNKKQKVVKMDIGNKIKIKIYY